MHVPDPPDQPTAGQQDRGDRGRGERVVLGDTPLAAQPRQTGGDGGDRRRGAGVRRRLRRLAATRSAARAPPLRPP
ncbi:hypothetical protein ACFQX6_02925 [Streptosporangium lutulentum]